MSAYSRLQWIERQLANIMGRLDAITADIEAGLSLSEMGFSDPQEMHDLLKDMHAQISQLLAMSRMLTMGLARG
ncbi:hypothetical protein CBP36_21235 (plasmid) [Acidovorax carolinensis]|uniref:Uncharacterized protein n=1 Tax=Acidovorax carolinensis TaxID=553814 RepID=A0A240UK91_9BURK|nr:hypothetical protein CBP36_21235 [Acidovorax carolinensis]